MPRTFDQFVINGTRVAPSALIAALHFTEDTEGIGDAGDSFTQTTCVADSVGASAAGYRSTGDWGSAFAGRLPERDEAGETDDHRSPPRRYQRRLSRKPWKPAVWEPNS